MAFCRTLWRRSQRRRSTAFELLEGRRVLAAVAGTVYEDVNANSTLDPLEPRLSNVIVYIDSNENGQLDELGFGLDPDEFLPGDVLSNSHPSILPFAAGIDNVPSSPVRAVKDSDHASTGDLVFGQGDDALWTVDRRLRFDFLEPAASVSLDVIGASGINMADVVMDVYSGDGTLLDSVAIDDVSNGQISHFTFERAEHDIAYVVAYVIGDRGSVVFDNLGVNDSGSERSTFSSEIGFYRFMNEPAGPITIAQQVPDGYVQTSPFPELSHTTVTADAISNLNFGNQTSSVEGFAFSDAGMPGVYEPAIDHGVEGAAVYLDLNRNGIPDQQSVSIDPDLLTTSQSVSTASFDVPISTADGSNRPIEESVMAIVDEILGGQVFGHDGVAAWSADRRLRVDFPALASTVELDFVAGAEVGQEKGVLIAFSVSGDPIASTTTRLLEQGQRQTMAILRSGFDISYVVAYTVESESSQGRLDNLRATTVAEPVAVADDVGEFQFRPLRDGTYRVGALPVSGQQVTFPDMPFYEVDLGIGDKVIDVDFGFRSTNRPPVARADSMSTIEENPIGIGVLLNDSDVDGVINPGSIVITQAPMHGTAAITVDGFINYTPDEDFSGRDTLIYTVRDDQAAESNSAIVSIDVAPINDDPVAVNDMVTVAGSSPTVIDVLRNDLDVDGNVDRMTIVIDSEPTNGSVEVDGLTGNIAYTPASAAGDSFTYRVRDDRGALSNAGVVTIVSQSGGTAPVANDDTASILEGRRTDIQILSNDSDEDGTIDADSIVLVRSPSRGKVSVADGFVSYQPNLGFVGKDSFLYLIRDDSGLSSNHARVEIDITERDFPYQNPIDALDVNGDGFIVPRDALLIINEINDRQLSEPATGAITAATEPPARPTAYVDVNGDGFVASSDVLRIINALNSFDKPADDPVPAAAAAVFASTLDSIGEGDESDEQLS